MWGLFLVALSVGHLFLFGQKGRRALGLRWKSTSITLQLAGTDEPASFERSVDIGLFDDAEGPIGDQGDEAFDRAIGLHVTFDVDIVTDDVVTGRPDDEEASNLLAVTHLVDDSLMKGRRLRNPLPIRDLRGTDAERFIVLLRCRELSQSLRHTDLKVGKVFVRCLPRAFRTRSYTYHPTSDVSF